MRKQKKELKISSNCSTYCCSNKMDALMDYIRNDMDYLSWTVIGLPIAAMIFCGLLFMSHRKSKCKKIKQEKDSLKRQHRSIERMFEKS